MNYISTRGGGAVSPSHAVLAGIAPDGGLYVPERFPKIYQGIENLADMEYQDLAFKILSAFLTDFPEPTLKECVSQAYGNSFEHGVAPVKRVGSNYFMELFHGRTSAFKDVALSILPYLTLAAAKENNRIEKPVVLTATSGDTGKAALAGFAGVEGTYIVVFYPENGVSHVQKLQMQTQTGNNVLVLGIEGNFDQAQAGVKEIFTDAGISERLKRKGCALTSANSINIGRLLPQIVYYYHAYGQMLKSGDISIGDRLDFTVPTGNFGNILAGYYALKTGLPIGRLVCASNENNVLSDFFSTGEYNKNRPFYLTASPSMDILVSSNLERFLYHMCGDRQKISALMSGLSAEGRFSFDMPAQEITAGFATGTQARDAIGRVYKEGYVMDPHTAVAYAVYEGFRGANKNIILATASPYKFAQEVCAAIDSSDIEPLAALSRLEELSYQAGGEGMPEHIRQLSSKPTLHNRVCKREDMASEVLRFTDEMAGR